MLLPNHLYSVSRMLPLEVLWICTIVISDFHLRRSTMVSNLFLHKFHLICISHLVKWTPEYLSDYVSSEPFTLT